MLKIRSGKINFVVLFLMVILLVFGVAVVHLHTSIIKETQMVSDANDANSVLVIQTFTFSDANEPASD